MELLDLVPVLEDLPSGLLCRRKHRRLRQRGCATGDHTGKPKRQKLKAPTPQDTLVGMFRGPLLGGPSLEAYMSSSSIIRTNILLDSKAE